MLTDRANLKSIVYNGLWDPSSVAALSIINFGNFVEGHKKVIKGH